jgi:hypothetical protein
MFLLLVTGGLVAGGYAYYYWTESDEILAQMLHERLQEIAPDWQVDFKHTRFDFQGRIRIRDLSLKGPDETSPLLEIGEVILTIDRERMADPMPPVTSVVWSKARLHLAREADGQWNYQKLPAPKLDRDKAPLPEFHVHQGAIFVDFHDEAGGSAERVQIDKFDLRMIPRGARQFLVKMSAKIPKSEGISAEGNWQVDEGTWDVNGQVKNVVLDAPLAKLAAHISPDGRRGLARLDEFLKRKEARVDASNGNPPSGLGAQGSPPAGDPISRLGFRANADVQFRVAHGGASAPKEYKVSLRLLQGVLANPPFPFPLTDLRGQIDFNNQQIRFRDLSAQSGQVNVHIPRGQISDQGDMRPADFDLKITDLPFDERVPGLMPGPVEKIYRDLQPGGEADLVAHLEFDGRDRWSHDCDLFVRNGSATHKLFPYRVDQIQGTVKRRANRVEFSMQGRAGLQKVTLSGKVRNPGPEAESEFVIETAGIPIDERLRVACPPKVRRIIDELQAEGDLEGKAILSRPAGLGQVMSITMDARLTNGAVNCRHFPYALSDVSGRFKGGGENWDFEDFHGRHGPAEVVLNGNYGRNRAGRLRLLMDFSLDGADLDRKLQEALPASAQAVWREFNPEGRLNISGRAYWRPEEGPEGMFQMGKCQAELCDARLTLNSFPYPINEVAARVQYDGEKVLITKFTGRHDETLMRFEIGTATCTSDGEWCVRLEKMFVDELEANPQFRRALPARLAEFVNTLNPRGKQSISGMVEFKGKTGGGYPVTAAWDTETVYSGITVNAGVELREVRGKASFTGTWDGREANGDGTIKLNSLKIFNRYQLTDIAGPVSLRGTRLVLGSEPPEGKTRPVEPNPSERISARFIEGLVLLDAAVVLGEPMRYRVLLTLKDGSLKRYAQMYMAGNNSRLAGRMNGNVDLSGEGTSPKYLQGIGKLTITRAAIYDLPLMVKIFNTLSFVPPDKAAFNSARFVFGVRNGKVGFERIDLEGDAINMVGEGTVDFDGAVRLRFASRMGSKTLPIPIMHDLVNMTTQGLVGVDVTGTLQDQKFEVRSLPQVDDALRRLFDPRMSRK